MLLLMPPLLLRSLSLFHRLLAPLPLRLPLNSLLPTVLVLRHLLPPRGHPRARPTRPNQHRQRRAVSHRHRPCWAPPRPRRARQKQRAAQAAARRPCGSPARSQRQTASARLRLRPSRHRRLSRRLAPRRQPCLQSHPASRQARPPEPCRRQASPREKGALASARKCTRPRKCGALPPECAALNPLRRRKGCTLSARGRALRAKGAGRGAAPRQPRGSAQLAQAARAPCGSCAPRGTAAAAGRALDGVCLGAQGFWLRARPRVQE